MALIYLSTCGCGVGRKLGKAIGTCSPVREEITKRHPDEEVDFRVFGPGKRGTIAGVRIIFINTSLNDKALDERKKRAQETADIVKSHCPEIKDIEEIQVLFSKIGVTAGIFNTKIVYSLHRFDNNGRLIPDKGPTITEPKEFDSNSSINENRIIPQVSYSPQQDQTEIYVEGIQLEGVAGHGLTIMPRLIVPGDTSKVTPRPPKNATFDFASFDEKQRFPGLTKVEFVGDEKVIYGSEEQFSTSKTNDGLVSEFLYLTVPYSRFVQMIKGKTLSVKLNDQKYQLTGEQLQALRKLTTYVKD